MVIEKVVGNDFDYRYVIVELMKDNKIVIVKVGMKVSVLDQFNEVLKLLKENVN